MKRRAATRVGARPQMATDAGLVVDPEATRAQFEGAAIFGASIVRSGEITATNGMPSFKSSLNDGQIHEIVEYIRTLAAKK